MATRSAATSALVVALLVCGCSSHRVLVPPRLDLRPYGSLGLITFSAENAKGSLPQYATDRFSEEILSAQPGVEGEHVGTPTRVEALEDPARVDLHDEEAVVDVTGHEGPPRHRIEVQAVALVAAG